MDRESGPNQEDTMTITTTPGTYDGKTAAEWRAEAAASRQRSAESWERSDTDGFMSQWASNTMAREYEVKATLAENDGKAEFTALFDLDGNLVPAKYIETRYGWAWALLDPENPNGRFLGFVNESNAATAEKRAKALAKKGYRLGTVLVPAYVKLVGANAVSVGPALFRKDGGFDPNAEVVSTGGAE